MVELSHKTPALVGTWTLIAASDQPLDAINVRSMRLVIHADGRFTWKTAMSGKWEGATLQGEGRWNVSGDHVEYSTGEWSGISRALVEGSQLTLEPDFLLEIDATPLVGRYERADGIQPTSTRAKNERFGHSLAIHAIGPFATCLFASLAYGSSVADFVRGGVLLRIGLVAACAILAVATLLLYLLSGIQRYEATDAGLVIRRPWSRFTVPWANIHRIRWNPALHYVVLRGERSVIAFTSTDFFPKIVDLLRLVHRRSNCQLDKHLKQAFTRIDALWPTKAPSHLRLPNA